VPRSRLLMCVACFFHRWCTTVWGETTIACSWRCSQLFQSSLRCGRLSTVSLPCITQMPHALCGHRAPGSCIF
jgi:hypothetical protein